MDIRIGSEADATTTEKREKSNGYFGKIVEGKDDDPEKLYGKRYRIFYPAHIRKSASVSVPDSDSWYKMSAYPRGRMLIINMKNFEQSTGLDATPREGSGADVESLVRLFLKFGYIIEVYDDLRTSEWLKVMGKASKRSYRSYNAFICAILTYGQKELVYATDGSVETKKITKMFCGPNLAGIPKIFLIQACQSFEYMRGTDEHDGKAEKQQIMTLPTEADFVYAYSPDSGYFSSKRAKTGSWFIQTLCYVLREHAKETDLMRMLTIVNEMVAEERSTFNETESTNMRQIASVVSQLRKEFYFFPPL